MEKDNLKSGNHKWSITGCDRPRLLRVIVLIALALQVLGMGVPSGILATSYFPLYHRQEKLEVHMKTGETIYLFHSGTDDVKKTIHTSDVLTVYRIDTSCEVKPVGRIKVASYIGENYLKGVVVEGDVMPNDIARVGNVSCLVILTGTCPP